MQGKVRYTLSADINNALNVSDRYDCRSRAHRRYDLRRRVHVRGGRILLRGHSSVYC